MSETVLICGHKNPDNDSICAAIAAAYIANTQNAAAQDVEYKAVRLGALPAESAWLINEFGLKEPELIESVAEGQKLILVDHNEPRQAVDGMPGAALLAVVDHHALAGLSTSAPIRYTNLPVGSTCTVLTREMLNMGMEIPANIAACLLSAILTDTVIMKSPTTTDLDREYVAMLAGIANVDPVAFGKQLFNCRGNAADLPVASIIGADAKEFELKTGVCYIAQYETVDLQSVLGREAEIRQAMAEMVAQKGYQFFLFLATDILEEGSQFICEGDTAFVSEVFGVDLNDGNTAWMPGVLSRKKQVAAPILAK
ncbi:MAG: manganese-dependent inorganic pyrophosphatase [Eggerthellales bacterium]|nr:manganese-dependent inorganic pyrophosphatase [Eggerthellales bacterium]